MRFHEPEWVGHVVQCENCRLKFTLEARDKDEVKFASYNPYSRQVLYFRVKSCFGCGEAIEFMINLETKKVSPPPNVDVIEAEVQVIQVIREQVVDRHNRRLLPDR